MTLLIAGAAALVAAGPPGAHASCSHATAVRVGTQLHWGTGAHRPTSPVGQVLCGPLAGTGSRAMVATLKGSRCGGAPTQWAVFRFTGGKWHRVLLRHNGATLAKQGADISEQVDLPRPGEHCLPTRWRVRTWHWTGHAFAHTAFQVIPDGPNPAGFLSPDRNIWCVLGPARAFCGSNAPDQTAELSQSARLTTCTTAPCLQNFDSGAPVLAGGATTEIFGYRCTAEADAVTCVVRTTGKGFRIAAAGITRVG
jgi:hypothetical protein